MGQFAHRARQITHLIQKIKVAAINDSPTLDLVVLINVLILPRGYVYVDPEGRIHCVIINERQSWTNFVGMPFGPNLNVFPVGLMHTVDVCWTFDSLSGEWNVKKDRTGVFSRMCPVRFGGCPAVKATAT